MNRGKSEPGDCSGPTERIDASPKQYLELIRDAEACLGIRIITPEYEIAAALFDVESSTPLELLEKFHGSPANFFKILKSLETKGVICAERNGSDRRSKLYRLSDLALETLAAQWARYKAHGRREIYDTGSPGEIVHNYTKTITHTLKVRQFTSEFQILLYVDASPGLTHLKYSNFVDVSHAKFNISLRILKEKGLIVFSDCENDRRRKMYCTSLIVSECFGRMNSSIFSWLNSKSGLFSGLLK